MSEALPPAVRLRELATRLRYVGRRVPRFRAYRQALRGKRGLEVGGPSKIFRTRLPLYDVVAGLDGANFSGTTVWEGKLEPGRTFRYAKGRLGTQYLCEATNLAPIASGTYDFVLSFNSLEHVANPLLALEEWRRVTRPGGFLLVGVPRREAGPDRRRPVTAMSHLLEDRRNGVTEHDLTHVPEVLALHDLPLDPGVESPEHLRARSLDNFANRCLHHHVFDAALLRQVLEHGGYEVVVESVTASDSYALGRMK